MDFGVDFSCFLEALGAVFLILCPGNKFENAWIFGVDLDLEFMGGGGKSPRFFGLVNSLAAHG